VTGTGSLAGLTRAEVEDFLYAEAELLDAWELDDWLALYTADARYVIPCTGDPAGDPSRDLVLIDDDRLRMQARVERLNSRKAHREYPHSNTRHLVTNVRLGAAEAGELPVRASFTVWRFRGGRETSYEPPARWPARSRSSPAAAPGSAFTSPGGCWPTALAWCWPG
jgi:p-cumate 2,3-dioxygenase beta subunit